MSKNINLSYTNKKDIKEILNEYTEKKLKLIETFGQERLDGWKNILIYGNNIDALRLLLQNIEIKEKISLVYIDPPFSTNGDFKIGTDRTSTVSYSKKDKNAYEDKLVGSDYIEFLRERLIFIRKILSLTGSIYVHIDWKMGHYVKVLMDEIFGLSNFINDITRIKCNPKNFSRKGFGNIKDIVLYYSKTENYIFNETRESFSEEDINRLYPKIDKDGKKYATTPLHAPGETENGLTGQEWKGKKPPKGRHWRYRPKVLDELDGLGLVEWSSKGNPRKKVFADDVIDKGKKRQDIWYFKDPQYPKYPTEKNLNMIKVIVETSSNKGDIVLDCFAGSGITLMAAEQLGRKWIGIDNSEHSVKVIKERMKTIENCNAYSIFRII